MQQSCSITGNATGNVIEIPEIGGPRVSTKLDAAHSAPLGSVLTPHQGEQTEGSTTARSHSIIQSAFAGSEQAAVRGDSAARRGRGRHSAASKKNGTQALIQTRGLPFAFHHKQAGHPAFARNHIPDPDLAIMCGFRPTQHTFPSHSSHPSLPSHSSRQKPSRQLSSDEAVAPVPVRISAEALPPPRPAEMPFASVPLPGQRQDHGSQPGPSSKPEWDTTTTADIPALPSRPKTAFPRSTPPPRISTSRSTPPVGRRGSPARIRPPHSPSNARVMLSQSSHRAHSLMPHRTPPRITPPSQQSTTPIRGTPSRGTHHAPKQRNSASGEPQEYEDNGAIIPNMLILCQRQIWSTGSNQSVEYKFYKSETSK